MNSRQVITAAIWRARKREWKGRNFEVDMLYCLFDAAYTYCCCSSGEVYDAIDMFLDWENFQKHEMGHPIPDYVVYYIRKVLYPEFLLVNRPPPTLLLGYERKES